MPTVLSDVRFQGELGRHLLTLSSSQFDPDRTLRALSCVNDLRKGVLKAGAGIDFGHCWKSFHGSRASVRSHRTLLDLLGFVPHPAKGVASGPVRLSSPVDWRLRDSGWAAAADARSDRTSGYGAGDFGWTLFPADAVLANDPPVSAPGRVGNAI